MERNTLTEGAAKSLQKGDFYDSINGNENGHTCLLFRVVYEQDTRRLYLCAKSIFSQFGYEIQFIAQCGRLPYFLYQKSDADSVPFRRIEGLQAVLIGNDYVLWQGY